MNKEFEEGNAITIPINYKSFIYFLIKNNVVVYVGQTRQGLYRPFSHRDKEYDEMKIILCDEKKLDLIEDKYILKYKPIYNKEINNAYSLHNARNKIRKILNNNITIPKLKKVIQELSINYFEFNNKNYLTYTDFKKIINYLEGNKWYGSF